MIALPASGSIWVFGVLRLAAMVNQLIIAYRCEQES
jgi:hypothetical protein